MSRCRGRTMSDTESIVCLSESDEDEVREIPQYDDMNDEGQDSLVEKNSVSDSQLVQKTGEDEGGVLLREESFVETKVNLDECIFGKQDMTTQTDEEFAQNDLEKKDSESGIQRKLPENGYVASKDFQKNDGEEDAECRNAVAYYRSRNNSTTSCSNNRQFQHNVSVNTGASTRKYVQKTWNQTRNRPQPYNRPNYNFTHSYNYFGIPTPNYNNFNRQIVPVRERYIRQFKEYLCKSFEHFLNNTLPFTFSEGFNNNSQQGPNNNLQQGPNNNLQQGPNNNLQQSPNNLQQGPNNNLQQSPNNLQQGPNNNFPQNNNNFPQYNNNYPQNNNFPQNNSNFPQNNNNFPQGINFPQGNHYQRN